MKKVPIYKPYLRQIAQITDFLYLCGIFAVTKQNILKYKINCVITVCKEGRKRSFSDVELVRLDLIDKKSESLIEHFDAIADKIREIETSKKTCLIHCVGGNSRSPSLVMGKGNVFNLSDFELNVCSNFCCCCCCFKAYLMKHRGLSLREAHDLVKEKRKYTRPNMGFWNQLVEYEKKLFGKNTVSLIKSDDGIVKPDIYKDEEESFGKNLTYKLINFYSTCSNRTLGWKKVPIVYFICFHFLLKKIDCLID